MVKVASWGRLARSPHDILPLRDRRGVPRLLKENGPGLAHGMGRSYGDVCLNPGGRLWLTAGLDHLIAFDEKKGLLTCAAGATLRDIQRLFLPRGWTLPVTPGTQQITVGGAIANDVHGKNHHRRGSFGDHVESLTLARTDGSVILCGPRQERGLFAATVGGIGLTGVITEACLRLQECPGGWIMAEDIPFAGLEEFFTLSDESEAGFEHAVAWVDCITNGGGRGIFMRGNPAAASRPAPFRREKRIPVTPPFPVVNALSLRLFNAAYFEIRKARAGRRLVPAETFLYPLDSLLEWNRIYGPKGFFQYQCVVPRDGGVEALRAMLDAIARTGDGSFLAVLKTFGRRESLGMLGFPRPGVTLALDFPNRGARSHKLFARLDSIVRAAKGRLYLAKDARMPRDFFEESTPRLAEFLPYRDPGISSAASRRLMGS